MFPPGLLWSFLRTSIETWTILFLQGVCEQKKTQSLKWDEGCPLRVVLKTFHSLDLDLRIGSLGKEDLEAWKSSKINFSES